MKTFDELFDKIVSLPNLYVAFMEAKKSRKGSEECIEFENNLHDNLWNLHLELVSGSYVPLECAVFYVEDYKRRKITAPSFKDHVLHHAIFNFLEQIYDSHFIYDSYACREGKGTHNAFKRLKSMINKSRKDDYFIKCDITKYFYSVDHDRLIEIIKKKIKDEKLIDILSRVIQFHNEELSLGWISNPKNEIQKKGMPIGSLLSQLFANVYLNELDYFVKHKLKIRKYVRYVDDFIIIEEDKERANEIHNIISSFLRDNLFIKLERRKTQINKIKFGVDFAGYVGFKHYVRVRSRNYKRFRQRIKKKINLFKKGEITFRSINSSFTSYLGHLSYTNSNKIQRDIKALYSDIKKFARDNAKKNKIAFKTEDFFSGEFSMKSYVRALAAVIRGGSWNNGADAGVFSANLNNAPTNTNSNIGFRCSGPLCKTISLRGFVCKWCMALTFISDENARRVRADNADPPMIFWEDNSVVRATEKSDFYPNKKVYYTPKIHYIRDDTRKEVLVNES